MNDYFNSAAMKQTPYYKRQEKIDNLIKQRDDINRQLSAIQREIDRENNASFNKVMNQYNQTMKDRNHGIKVT